MTRFRPIEVVKILTSEEKTRFAQFFTLLVEIDLRLPKSTKIKKRTNLKTQQKRIETEPSYIKCPATRSSRTALRDLYLESFARIFRCNVINFILGYSNDRHYSFNFNA